MSIEEEQVDEDSDRHQRLVILLAGELAAVDTTTARQIAAHPQREAILDQAATDVAHTLDAGTSAYTRPGDNPGDDDVLVLDPEEQEPIAVAALVQDLHYWRALIS